MTDVVIYETPDRYAVGFEARNHSGFAQSGDDVVCAGVTTVFEVAQSGLSDLSSDHYRQTRGEESQPHWSIRVDYSVMDAETADEVRRLLEACRDTLKQIGENYPDHCSVVTRQATSAT